MPLRYVGKVDVLGYGNFHYISPTSLVYHLLILNSGT